MWCAITSQADLQEVGADGVDEVVSRELVEYGQVAWLDELREFFTQKLQRLSVNPLAAVWLGAPLQYRRQRVDCQRLGYYVLAPCAQQQHAAILLLFPQIYTKD